MFGVDEWSFPSLSVSRGEGQRAGRRRAGRRAVLWEERVGLATDHLFVGSTGIETAPGYFHVSDANLGTHYEMPLHPHPEPPAPPPPARPQQSLRVGCWLSATVFVGLSWRGSPYGVALGGSSCVWGLGLLRRGSPEKRFSCGDSLTLASASRLLVLGVGSGGWVAAWTPLSRSGAAWRRVSA